MQVTKQMDKQMNHMRKRLVAVSIAGFMADTIDVESPFATSAAGQTAKPGLTTGKSALPSRTDIVSPACQVRKVPCVDGSGLARAFFTFCSVGRCSHVFGLLVRFT